MPFIWEISMVTPSLEMHKNYLTIAKTIRHLTEHQTGQPSLKELAELSGLSEYHFQRVFTEWAGVSPKLFLSYLTKENAKNKLKESSVLKASLDIGLSGSSRLHDLFVTYQSMTPGEYKTLGQGINITYGIHSCMFGFCLIAITSRGICKLAFFDNDDEKDKYINELFEEWKNASFVYNHHQTEYFYKQIFCDVRNQEKPIQLLLKGTPFKLQVWQALLTIPEGQLSTYSHIAHRMDNAKAVRAVASAIANNPIAYLIPCHRVIRNTGVFNEYRWGKERKAAMIAREQSLLQIEGK